MNSIIRIQIGVVVLLFLWISLFGLQSYSGLRFPVHKNAPSENKAHGLRPWVFWESSYMIENQKETPQEKPKSTPIVVVTSIVAHSTSFSSRPKTTGYRWWNGAWRAKLMGFFAFLFSGQFVCSSFVSNSWGRISLLIYRDIEVLFFRRNPTSSW